MNCKDFWKKYEEYGITHEFEMHLLDCANCRKEFEAEKVLLKVTSSFPEYQAPDHLWDRISEALPEKNIFLNRTQAFIETIAARISGLLSRIQTVPLKPVFATLVVMLVSILATHYYHTLSLSPVEKIVLQDKIAHELEEKEQEYVAAIDKLSKLVENKKETIDPELFDLYQEKLALLDDYILQCKEALDGNEYNINARTYLALALKEKADTLQEMYESINKPKA